jgi:hypothetical protein
LTSGGGEREGTSVTKVLLAVLRNWGLDASRAR